MKTIKEFKEEQKQGAEELRQFRYEVKKAQREKRFGYNDPSPWDLYKKSREWRHRHIAYCMLRGREYGEIEQIVRDGNEPDMRLVKSIMAEYYTPEKENEGSERDVQAKAVCAGKA